jgi:uncharacterized protein DUF4145
MQGLPVLTGIGIRAIVETVCNERGTTGTKLFQKINSLVTLKLITQQEATVLHDLRFMGNEAAHKVKAHSPDELNLAFDVVEHLLNTVYLLAEQTKRLPIKKPGQRREMTTKGSELRRSKWHFLNPSHVWCPLFQLDRTLQATAVVATRLSTWCPSPGSSCSSTLATWRD